MQTITWLSLQLRARILHRPAARAELARLRLASAQGQWESALRRIENKQMEMATRYWESPCSERKLRAQALSLASIRTLSRQMSSDPSQSVPVTSPCPLQRMRSFESILLDVKRAAPWQADVRAKEQLERLLAPQSIRMAGRQMLAKSFWRGDLDEYAEFAAKVLDLADIEETQARLDKGVDAGSSPGAVSDILTAIWTHRPRNASSKRSAWLSLYSPMVEQEAQDRRRWTPVPPEPSSQCGSSPCLPGRVSSENVTSLPRSQVPRVSGLSLPATELEKLNQDYWADRINDYDKLERRVACIVTQATGHIPPGRELREARYRRTLEVLDHLEEHQPPEPVHELYTSRFLFKPFAAAMERAALNRLRASGVPGTAQETPTRQTDVGQARERLPASWGPAVLSTK